MTGARIQPQAPSRAFLRNGFLFTEDVAVSWSERWELGDKLGEGGQGTVHLVRDKTQNVDLGRLPKKLRNAISELSATELLGKFRTVELLKWNG